jgi:hypothetical protein
MAGEIIGLKHFMIGFLAVLVCAVLLFVLLTQTLSSKSDVNSPLYVGVSFNGSTVEQAKLLIDRVKGYTNLFVLGSSPVSRNETATSEVCDYAISQGLNIIVNFGYYDPSASSPEETFRQWPWQHLWVQEATQKYGNRFLGVYYDDEPGGTTLDYHWREFFANYSSYLSLPLNTTLHEIYAKYVEANVTGILPSNYNLEASYFQSVLTSAFYHGPREAEVATFTSDYALYWFDYLGGYNVMLAEFGWNHTTLQDIAFVKGAAHMQNKLWGAMVTWKYDQPPYLASGDEIYGQMVQAYQAGATYIMVFDYPYLPGNDYGVMTDEHFGALERFWNNVVEPGLGHAREYGSADVALVLPKNYGWGMRSPQDTIWGMWGPDDKSAQIWQNKQTLLAEYGLRLDIVYGDSAYPTAGRYNRVYLWNDTGI